MRSNAVGGVTSLAWEGATMMPLQYDCTVWMIFKNNKYQKEWHNDNKPFKKRLWGISENRTRCGFSKVCHYKSVSRKAQQSPNSLTFKELWPIWSFRKSKCLRCSTIPKEKTTFRSIYVLTKYFQKCKAVKTVDKKGCVTLCVCVSDEVAGVQGAILGRVTLWVSQWNRVPLRTR